MGPANAIVGDQSPTELPQSNIEPDDLAAEKNAAKFSRTAEFKVLKEYLLRRIAYYQTILPDGRDVSSAPEAERMSLWIVANRIIAELQAIIDEYERAQQVVEEAARSAAAKLN